MANKQPKLTMAQVYTLRRIASGTRYIMTGDGRRADECRADCSSRGWHPVKSASIPALFRLGLIEFDPPLSGHAVTVFRSPTQYYAIRLTHAGRVALNETKDRTK